MTKKEKLEIKLTEMYESKMEPELVEEYDLIVKEMLDELGPEADCQDIDPHLYSLYSDMYADNHGVKPDFSISYQEVKRELEMSEESVEYQNEDAKAEEFAASGLSMKSAMQQAFEAAGLNP